MDENRFQKGIDDLKKIKMNGADSNRMFLKLQEYQEYQEYTAENDSKHIVSPWYKKIETFTFTYAGYAAVFIFIFGLAGFKTISAAQKSLPGDTLYPLKVNIIEPLQYTLAIGQLAKANIEAQNVVSRLTEAEKLQSEGRLGTSSQQDLAARLISHANSFNNLISSTTDQSEVAVDSRIDFEAKMKAHSRVFAEILASTTQNKDNAIKLGGVIENETEKATKDREKAEENFINVNFNLSSTTSTTTINAIFRNRKKATQSLIDSAKKRITNNQNSSDLSKKILNDGRANLNDAESQLENAEKSSKSEDNVNAISNLLESRKKASEADASFEAQINLDND